MKISRKWRRSWERCYSFNPLDNMRGQFKKGIAGMGRAAVAAGLTLSVLAGVQPAYALPSGGSITAGQGQLNQSGNTLTVTQNTDKLALNWQSFNIGQGEHVQFLQPGAQSVALNRIVGNDASRIYGQLSANGKVFLINPKGILFAPASQVNVGGLVASSLSLSDSDFLNGRYTFAGSGTNGTVVNQGSIHTADGGYAVLLGGKASNEGVILANKGSIALGAGNEATLDFTGDGLINLSVSQAALDAQVTNSHLLQADGGLVVMTAKAAGDLTGAVVNNTGTVRAQSLVERDGRILLDGGTTGWVKTGGTLDVSGQAGRAGGQIAVSGQTVSLTGQLSADGFRGGHIAATAGSNMEQTGTLKANGQDQGGSISLTAGNNLIQTSAARLAVNGGSGGVIQQSAGNQIYTSADYQAKGAEGGTIQLSGKTIKFMGADADASGTSGNGGTITIGGGWQGAAVNGEANADSVVVGSGATLSADGGANGNGGKIVVWSEDDTAFAGILSAAGGKVGGQMEVSGKENLLFAGQVATGRGKAASLLLDPKNITVVESVTGLDSFSLVDPNPGTTNAFGTNTTALANGNIVVASPGDSHTANRAGAVYLFNGTTGELISALHGSHDYDQIGTTAITTLTNGNYVVSSYAWSGYKGAVTWGSGTNGVSGVVDSTNSLVGTKSNDWVGFGGVTALTNGNYVVASPSWDNGSIVDAGAATWGNGLSGVVGEVSSDNSLVGTKANDRVANFPVTALTNGNYVVRSSSWANGNLTQAGAVTWGNGNVGIKGAVGLDNSLVGSHANDSIGSAYGGTQGVVALTNGNYVVVSPSWKNTNAASVGAVTWGDGTSGVKGIISTDNSLVGTTAADQLGNNGSTPCVVALTNGNYVVVSTYWDNGSIVDAGAVTWGNGSSGTKGTVSSANSLVGTKANDRLGNRGVTALANGNYVVASSDWDNNGIVDAGAATWGDGTSGVTGAVNSTNSLVGTKTSDQIGYNGVTALTNGNYVVASSQWDSSSAANVGAVTWGDGEIGLTGVVSSDNSLVGTTANDWVGVNRVAALTNGNYVVLSSNWKNNGVSVGAATWGDGSRGLTGAVSTANSLVGTKSGDQIGYDGVTALSNGNYVVKSSNWANGDARQAGAVTWGNGISGVTGEVSSANSLVGMKANDKVGSGGVMALSNGNYVVRSYNWNNNGAVNAGAVTWGNGANGVTGEVSTANSLVGTNASDYFGGSPIGILGDYAVVANGLGAGRVDIVRGLYTSDAAAGQTYSANPGGSVTITAGRLGDILKTGTALTLQANNDITVNSNVTVVADEGVTAGGDLTLAAGRSVYLNGNITTGGGSLTVLANDTTANGVVDAHRDNGEAVITMSAGTAIDAGSGTVSLTLGTGEGLTHGEAGTISLQDITAGSIAIANTGSGTRNIVLNGELNAGAGTVSLSAGGTVSQLAGLAAGKLLLGSGTYELTNTGNHFAVLAAQGAGDIDLYDASALTVGSVNGIEGVNGSGSIKLATAAGENLTLQQGVATTASNITLVSGNNFINHAGSSALSPGSGGRWLVYSTDPSANTVGGLSYQFKQYGATYGDNVQGSGSGFLYTLVPTLTVGLTGTVAKTYDGSDIAGVSAGNYAVVTGAILGDTVELAHTSASYNDKNAGANKVVTVAGLNIQSASDATGASVYGYELAGSTVSGSIGAIDKANISAVTDITAADKVYNGTRTAELGTGNAGFSGMVAGDSLNVATASGEFGDKNAGTNKAVSISGITLGGADAGNYTLVNNTATASAAIDKANISAVTGITAAGKIYDGTRTAELGTGNAGFSGMVTGDSLNVATASGEFSDKNAGTNKAVNISGITLGGSDAGNYTLVNNTATASAAIDKANISAVTGITAAGKVYDGTRTAGLNTGNAGFNGMVTGDSLNVATASGEFGDKNVGTNKAVSISGITLGGSDAGNYTLVNNTATASAAIDKANISAVTGITAADKVYNGTRTAELGTGNAGFSGMVAGDSLNVATASGEFGDKNAGTNKAVNISGITLGGSDADNYTLVNNTATASAAIDKANISAVTGITAADKVYNGTRTAELGTGNAGFSGMVTGDSLNVANASGEFSDKNAGTNKTVSISGITLGGSDAGNYTLAGNTATASATIDKATLSAVTGITAAGKVYDGTRTAELGTGSAGFSGMVAGDSLNVATASGEFSDKNASTNKTVNITGITLGGSDAGNYTLVNNTAIASASIDKATISAVTGITAAGKVYDGTRTAELGTGNAGFSGMVAGDSLNVATASGEFSDKNVGTNKTVSISGITLGSSDAGNYTLAGNTATASATIDKATLSAVTGITAADKVYDGTRTAELSTGSAGFSGMVAGDSLNVASASGEFSDKNASTNKTVNITGITLGGSDAGNYTLVNNTAIASATIDKATLSAVTGITAAGKVYDGTRTAELGTGNAGFSGMVAGDSLNVATASGEFSDKNVGTNKTVSISGITLGGSDADNYTLAGNTATASATIDKATLSAVTGITAAGKVYDGTRTAELGTGNAGFNGMVTGDSLNVANASGEFSDKNAGTNKTVSISGIILGGSDAGNYTLAGNTATASATIDKATLSAVTGITAADKVYDGTRTAELGTGSAGFSGMVAGDSLKVATASGEFSDKNAGTNKTVSISGITLGGSDAGNYMLADTGAAANADITPRQLAVTAIGQNKFYDGMAQATVTYSDDRISGDSLTVGGSAAFADSNPGIDKPITVSNLTVTGTDAANYTLVNETAGAAANILPMDQIETAIKHSNNQTAAQTAPSVPAAGGGNPPGTIEIVQSGIQPVSTLPAVVTVTATDGQAIGYRVVVTGSEVTLSRPGHSAGAVPSQSEITVVAFTGEGESRIRSYAIRVDGSSLSVGNGTAAVNLSAPREPLNDAPSTTFSLAGLDGQTAKFQAVYEEGALSIQPLNEPAAKMSSQEGHSHQLVIAAGMLAAQENLGAGLQSVVAVYIH